MRGLLTKDIRLIFGQKHFFAITLLLTMFFALREEMAAFGIAYLTMMIGMLTMMTISYDEYNNGSVFLFTMPVTRRGYAVEKYVLGMGLGAVSCLLVTVFTIMAGQMRHMDMDMAEFVGAAAGIYIALILMLALVLPMIFRFGAERGRLMFALIVVAGATALAGVGKAVDVSAVAEKLAWLDELGPVWLVCIAVLLLAAIVCASIFISIRIVEKKEF